MDTKLTKWILPILMLITETAVPAQTHLAEEHIQNFFRTMKELGYSAEEILALVKETAEKLSGEASSSPNLPKGAE